MQTLPPVYEWTREEYERLAAFGFFRDRRVELIAGQIVVMSPKNPPHAVTTDRVRDALLQCFWPDQYWVRVQEPLALSGTDEPEPDVAVVPGRRDDYWDHHPASAVLVVEVADSSLAFDRGRKADRYAAAGIADYWVVNLVDRQIEVSRDPRPEPSSETGGRYGTQRVWPPGTSIVPLAAPDCVVAVAAILP